MNVEELLKRIPELAPSPELEARIAAAAKPRGPRIVPLAAAVLFCIGVGWFAVSTPAGKGRPEGPFRVIFSAEGERWRIMADGRNLADPSELVVPADRSVIVVGPDATPWGLVLEVRRAAEKAGHPEIGWRIGEKEMRVNARLPKPPLVDLAIRLEDISVVFRPGLEKGATVRTVGSRPPVASDEDLMRIIKRMVVDYGKAGKTWFPIVIDAAAEIPWREVVDVIELCRKAGYYEFQLERTPVLPPPPVKVPDVRRFPGRPQDD